MQLVENSIIFAGENNFWSLLFVFRGVKEDEWPFSMGIFCNKIPNLCQLILSKYYECSQNTPLIIKALQSSASKKVMQQRSWIWVGVKVSPSELLLQICYYQELGTYVLIIIIPVFLLYVHFLLLFFQYLLCFLLCVCSKTSTIFNNCLLWEMGCSTCQSCYNYFKHSQCNPQVSLK